VGRARAGTDHENWIHNEARARKSAYRRKVQVRHSSPEGANDLIRNGISSRTTNTSHHLRVASHYHRHRVIITSIAISTSTTVLAFVLPSLQPHQTAPHHDPAMQTTTSPLLKFILLTASLYIVPTLIHTAVRSLDTLHEVRGRRARAPYTLSSILVASALLVGWHVVLGRLSYKTIIEGKKKGSVSWGRVLGRVVVPGVLVIFGVIFGGEIAGEIFWGGARK
jgi:hypothetical protein